MTVNKIAHGRDICDKILVAVGANPDLVSEYSSVEVKLSAGCDFVEILIPETAKRELIAMTSFDAFNNLIKFCDIPNQDRCTWLSIKMESDCLVTMEMSAYLELKDE